MSLSDSNIVTSQLPYYAIKNTTGVDLQPFPVAIKWSPTPGAPDSFLTFDVCTTRIHEGSSEITEHPVESGANIADHVRPNLDTITIEAFISNEPVDENRMPGGAFVSTVLDIPEKPFSPFSLLSPATFLINAGSAAISNLINGPPTATLLQTDTPFDAVADTLKVLRGFRDSSQILSVITTEYSYNSMILESFQIAKNYDNGNGASISMTFKQILIVQVNVVTAPIATLPRAATAVNKGSKSTASIPASDPRSDAAIHYDAIVSAVHP